MRGAAAVSVMPSRNSTCSVSCGESGRWERRHTPCERGPSETTRAGGESVSSTAFIAPMSMLSPPSTAAMWPSSDVPTPKGITGILCCAAMRTASATSSVLRAKSTQSGGVGVKYASSFPWAASTAGARDRVSGGRAPSRSRIAAS